MAHNLYVINDQKFSIILESLNPSFTGSLYRINLEIHMNQTEHSEIKIVNCLKSDGKIPALNHFKAK